ncbi:hypothetical protein F1188_05540 [Roseospira marina]|uniref:Uncharacterized protein n=1 Tax=Roseospira marina TaxID=140057 RepID=A0A5M6IF85_9PROT|nr:hypothetical protein [Roseospira marina]KAA5606792.1 hypothetical protein F1188_05540 [Roseospira marina]MBB4313786.1 hypothetical protein [Roseospira marina]MBB5086948.1 hypothetical protein [Roseospira marina]
MTDAPNDQIATLLTHLARDVQRMGDAHARQSEAILGALDDLAASIMALKAIAAAQQAVTPADPARVRVWLENTLTEDPEAVERSWVLAKALLSPEV